jgi:ribosomal protein S18 acetylase RimI-like enzyme
LVVEPLTAVSMEIREYRTDDYDAVTALWRDGGLPYKPAGRDARESLARQVAGGAVFILIAEIGGEPVGTIMGSHDGRKGWLNRLAVAPAWRRAPAGVAVRLVNASEERFRGLGLEIFVCLIEGHNDASARFVERLGYVRFPDIGYYTKRLRPDI